MQEYQRCFLEDPSFRCYDPVTIPGATSRCNVDDDPDLWAANGSAPLDEWPPYVQLASDPFLSPRELPDGRFGYRDIDNDTLDDEMELALAEAFRPYIVYVVDPDFRAGDILGALLPGRRHALFDGVRLVIADRTDMIAFDLDGAMIRRQYDSVVVPGIVGGLRAEGPLLYAVLAWDRWGHVLRLDRHGFGRLGAFDLESFVDNAIAVDDRHVRRTRTGIEVAYHD